MVMQQDLGAIVIMHYYAQKFFYLIPPSFSLFSAVDVGLYISSRS
jgi:hypothetical protein